MGLRLYSEFHSSNNKLYKIEIHDTDFTGTAKTFVVDSNGFTLDYSGSTDDIVSPIISSKCSVNAYNKSNAFDLFIIDCKANQENRFFLKILIDEGSGYTLFWSGIVMQDLIQIEDTSKPYVYQITAVDGIGTLANKDFSNTNNITIEGFLEDAVTAIGLGTLYSSTDLLYATSVNIWDTAHTYSTSTDVLTLVRFKALVYAERDEDNNYIYTPYLDVLRELCIAFGARFYQRRGVFYFEQYIERTNSSRYVSKYQKNGTKASTASVSDDITLDQTSSGGARLAGNTFSYLPALKKVQIEFDQNRVSNLLANRISFTAVTPAQDLGFLTDDNDAKIKVTGQLTYQFHKTTPSGATASLEFYRPIFRMEIKIQDSSNPSTYYYLKRNWLNSNGQLFGATSWETTQNYYYLDAGIGRNDVSGFYISNPFQIITPPLPVDGEATIDMNFNNLRDESGAVQSVPINYTDTNTITEVTATFIDSADTPSIEVYSATNSGTDVNSNLILDLGKIRISDSGGMQGSFYVYNGSSWVASTIWRRGNSGTYQSLLKLLTTEVLSLHRKPIERYNGTIVGSFDFGQRYIFDSSNWLPMQGSYNANADEWASEWFKIGKDATNIAADDPIGSGGGAGFGASLSTQSGQAEIINSIDITSGALAVSNNATVGGTFGVTGSTTLAGTSVGEFTLTDRYNVSVNSITGNPGGSETITASNHFNFIGYSGANGNYQINLPSSENGIVLKFKTDDSVGANKTIELVPQSGERIDAESTYSMDRAYDGITLTGFGGNWFITQKKEK